MKRKPIKIKHHKYTLYNKKKSKSRQALTVVLTVLVAALLCVVGFGIGRPLMEFIQGDRQPADTSSAWTPPVTEEPAKDPTAEAVTVGAESVEAEPVEAADIVYELPASALKNTTALNNAVKAAKAQGCTGVMVTAKNSSGGFLYASEIDGVKGMDSVVGTLTAKQICDAITAEGLVPYAKISTLKDPLACDYISDVRYVTSDGWTWLDDAPANGGKSWVSPFASNTPKFVSSIVSELAAAGFKSIVLTDTVYPNFQYTDYTVYLSQMAGLDDPDTRVNALWKVISACSAAAKSSGAELIVELDAVDLDVADKTATSAELAADKAKLKNVRLLINCTFNGSYYPAAKSFAGKMGAMYSGQEYSVSINNSAMSETDKQDVIKAFDESDITVFLNN